MAQEKAGPSIDEIYPQPVVNRLVSEGHTPEVHRGEITIIKMNQIGDKSIGREVRSYASIQGAGETRVVKPGEAEVIEERLERAQRKVEQANQLKAALAMYGSENPLKHVTRSGKGLY